MKGGRSHRRRRDVQTTSCWNILILELQGSSDDEPSSDYGVMGEEHE